MVPTEQQMIAQKELGWQKMASSFITLGLGAVFVISSIGKMGNTVVFYYSILDFEIVPESAAYRMAMCLPWIELVISLCLLSGFLRNAALLLASALLGVFSFALIRAMILKLHVSCDCFGVITGRENTVGWTQVVRTTFLFALSCAAMVQTSRASSVTKSPTGPTENAPRPSAGGANHAAIA